MSPLPAPVTEFIAAAGWGTVSGSESVAGGCINDGRVLQTTAGARLFYKENQSAPPEMFRREAEGLFALMGAPDAPRVPGPWLAGDQFILLEYLAPAPQAADYWPTLGQRLAWMHDTTNATFGFYHNNYLGLTPQLNGWTADGYAFFAKKRILDQAKRAQRQGRLSLANLRRAERLASNLPNLVPEQPPSLLHGDLWLGNIIPGPDGQAWLIDPAAHFGWAEAELAMTALFGGPPDSFYDAYDSVRALTPGYRERFDIYNLYHLLNHLNLFGASYLESVETILSRHG